MNVKKGAKNIIYSLLGQIIALGLGIIVPRLLIVSYGSEVNGLLSSVGQVITYLALLEAGVGTAALQALYKPLAKDDKNDVNSILAATAYYYKRTGILYLGLVIVLSFVYPFCINTTLDYFFIVIIILLNGMPNVINYLFQGKLRIFLNAVGDGYVLTNLSTITSTLATILKIILLSFGVNVLFVQAIYCAISLLQMIVIYSYVKKKYGWIDFKVDPNLAALSKKSATLVHQICGLVTHSTDLILISIFVDLRAASIYAVYNMIFNIICQVANNVNGGIQFLLGETYNKDKEKYNKLINVYETYYVGLCSALMFVAYVMLIPFLKLYTEGADVNYVDSWLPILFVAVEMLRAIRNSSVNTISVAGAFKETSHHAIIESILNLGLSIVAVQFYGIHGVLIGTIIAFLYRDVVSIWYSNKKILKCSSKASLKISIGNLSFLALIMWLTTFMKWQIDNYIILFLVAGGVTVFSGIVFFVFNSLLSPQAFSLMWQYVKEKIKGRKNKENIVKD